MVGLISSSEAVGIRSAFSVFRTHTMTLTPQNVPVLDEDDMPTEDAHGNPIVTAGTPVTGIDCKYRADDRVRIDEAGSLIVRAPTIKVAHDLAVNVGDTVTAITNSEGVTLLSGPVTIGYIVASAGFGPTLAKRLVLHGAEVAP